MNKTNDNALIPKNEAQGKGMEHVIIGGGLAIAVGLVGYGVYEYLTPSSCSPGSACYKSMATCNTELEALVNQYTALSNEYLTADATANIAAYTTTQQTTLNNILAQENAVITDCIGKASSTYGLNFKDTVIGEIATAVSIAIVLIAGAKGLSYIRKKGYMKKPPQTPGGGAAIIQLGLLDYQIAIGKIPATWKDGDKSVANITSVLNNSVTTYTTEAVDAGLITAEIAAAMVVADTALISADSALLLAVLVA